MLNNIIWDSYTLYQHAFACEKYLWVFLATKKSSICGCYKNTCEDKAWWRKISVANKFISEIKLSPKKLFYSILYTFVHTCIHLSCQSFHFLTYWFQWNNSCNKSSIPWLWSCFFIASLTAVWSSSSSSFLAVSSSDSDESELSVETLWRPWTWAAFTLCRLLVFFIL